MEKPYRIVSSMIQRFDRIESYPLRVSKTEKEVYSRFVSEGAEFSLISYMEHELELAKAKTPVTIDFKSIGEYLEKEVGIWFREECKRRGVEQEDAHRAKEAILKRMRDVMTQTLGTTLRRPFFGTPTS